MTEKQINILQAALELFAEEGFKSTSTSKVAQKAGVSEGLIFRHFTNKEGLLEAILKEGEAKAKELFGDILAESDPKEVLRKTIEVGLKLKSSPDTYRFWKLQFKLKWELEYYAEHKMQDLREKLTDAFQYLRYKNPEMEANLLLVILDGMATRFLLQQSYDLQFMIDYLIQKYGL
ncbi:MAG: helix-turn-helix transcriptional regulator [Flavobacteriales bacterium]|nr:helix-turn-helix transcriptional regulator [Flavobacteriales bacterium]